MAQLVGRNRPSPLVILDTEADGLVPCASAGASEVAGAGDSRAIDAPHECIVAPGGDPRNGSGYREVAGKGDGVNHNRESTSLYGGQVIEGT
jgi:hypothetical protein